MDKNEMKTITEKHS